MSEMTSEAADRLLAAARRAGADGADALAVQGTALSIEAMNGALEQAERSEGIDLGLRVFVGQKQACVSGSDIATDSIDMMAERAVAMAMAAPSDPHARLAEQSELLNASGTDDLELADPSPEPTPDALLAMAAEAEATARSVEGISKIDAASAAYSSRQIHLATSNGFSAGYARTDWSLVCVAITGDGTEMERDYCGEGRIFASDLPTPEYVGRLAAERTMARSGANKPPTGSFPVLFDERISGSLIGHILSAANGASVARGSSWLREDLGKEILPAHLSLFEDPHRRRIPSSKLFDAEGIPTTKRAIVKNGVLMGWTLDLATGSKLAMKSTGNAARGTSAPPSPSNHGVSLTQGDHSRDDLIKDMGTGLLITSMIGSTINPTTGDYSRGASGFWVENGEIAYPVNECTVAGNLRDMLRTIVPANDARPHLSRIVPSILVESMTIAGK